VKRQPIQASQAGFATFGLGQVFEISGEVGFGAPVDPRAQLAPWWAFAARPHSQERVGANAEAFGKRTPPNEAVFRLMTGHIGIAHGL
jgi:hypothetical protein